MRALYAFDHLLSRVISPLEMDSSIKVSVMSFLYFLFLFQCSENSRCVFSDY
jgi:hypothetical protein